jgi:hypothetical protein
MANSAPQIQYRQELVKLFEQRTALIRQSVTTEAVIKGNQAVFDVVGSNHATATTRGVDGLIMARANYNSQNTATLVEWHDLRKITSFNVFESQGDQRKAMQESSLGVVNRKIDQDILGDLSAATLSTTVQTASLSQVAKAKAILGNNEVPMDSSITCIISPAFHGYLMQAKEFTSAQYVKTTPFSGQPIMFNWFGLNFIEHPNIVGKGTSSEQCYMYHKDAIGHAANVGGLSSVIGYDEEQDYSYARTTMFMGGKVLQNNGIVTMYHDGSSMVSAT